MAKSTTVVVEREMIDSPAFQSLSGMAVKILLIFLAKRQIKKVAHPSRDRWDIQNNGNITFSYLEARDRGINSKVFRSRLLELEAHGFLKKHQRSGGYSREMATYFLTSDWRKWRSGK